MNCPAIILQDPVPRWRPQRLLSRSAGLRVGRRHGGPGDENAGEALQLHLEGILEDEQPISESGGANLNACRRDSRFAEALRALIPVDSAGLTANARRINITMPERILRNVDECAQQHGESRSAGLTHAALDFIGGKTAASHSD